MAVALATVASADVEHSAVERSSDGSDEAAVEEFDARSVPTGAGDPCEDAPAAAGVAEGDGCESSCSCYTQPSGSESLSCLVIFSWYLLLLLPLCRVFGLITSINQPLSLACTTVYFVSMK